MKAILKNIGLLAAGVLASLLLAEAVLRVSGFLVMTVQERRNLAALRAKGSYRVMCLGESTTQGQYPPFLEAELNRRGGGTRFSVIDEGRGGTNTDAILARLEAALDRYKPDLVVAMMGSNDLGSTQVPYEAPSSSGPLGLLRAFKTYKLARILFQLSSGESWVVRPPSGGAEMPEPARPRPAATGELADNVAVKELRARLAAAPEDPALRTALGWEYLGLRRLRQAQEEFSRALAASPATGGAGAGLGWAYLEQGRRELAEEVFGKVLAANPGDGRAHAGLGWLYFESGRLHLAAEPFARAVKLDPSCSMAHAGQGQLLVNKNLLRQAEAPFRKALELDPANIRARMGLGWSFLELGRSAQAEEQFRRVIGLDPSNDMARVGLGRTYMKQGKFRQAEETFGEVLRLNPGNETAFYGLDLLYKSRGGGAGSAGSRAEYLAEVRRYSDGYKAVTARNYLALKAALDRRKIRLVCVQYPMRSAAPLRNIFAGQEDQVIFVDNERPFQEGVRKEGYAAYFRDMFGGNFGHCTDKGNALLAENIAAAVLRASKK
ncbi:MAG: tetratricopeptide repeat protein [Elusimicrobiales bacterium]|nr:tetratricopeptide repeat protein [Elusimicrobiales bacterium]